MPSRSILGLRFKRLENKHFVGTRVYGVGGQIDVIKDDNGGYLLVNFIVAKKHRGKGFGQLLLDSVIKHYGHRRLWTLVEPSNVVSEHIFRKLGFIRTNQLMFNAHVYEKPGQGRR